MMVEAAKDKRQIDFFSELERAEIITQIFQILLSKRVSVPIEPINTLVIHTIKKGFAKVQSTPYKPYAYNLTPEGLQKTSKLVAEYLTASLPLFRVARTKLNGLFAQAFVKSLRHFARDRQIKLLETALISDHEHDADLLGMHTLEPRFFRSSSRHKNKMPARG